MELTGSMDAIPGIPGTGDAPIDIPPIVGKGSEICGTYIIDIGVDSVEGPTIGEKYVELGLPVNPGLERAMCSILCGPDVDW